MSDYPRASILIVDSDSESLFAMASILIAHHYKVQTARDASLALTVACHDSLDLVITDTQLKDAPGNRLIQEIRQFSNRAELPAMFVAENQTPDVIRRSYDSGGAFHLKKPIDSIVLCELVGKVLAVPHQETAHVKQRTILFPHVSFGNPPITRPLDAGSNAESIFAGTPITY